MPRRLLALLLGLIALQARAQVSVLGAAANYAGLEIGSSSTFAISKDTTFITSNVGVGSGGTLNFSGGGEITGEIDAGAGAHLNISGGSTADKGIMSPYAPMASIVQSAQNAAAYYAGLTPGTTLSSLGAGTITGTGGLDVFQINGNLSLSRSTLTISGSSTDQFVFNITGNINLSVSSIQLVGISASQVVFNLLGSGTVVTTSGDSNTSGIFLAQNGAMDIKGGTHNSEFIAGGNLTFESGVNISQPVTTLTAVPELGALPMGLGAVALVFGLGWMARISARKRQPLAA